VRYRQSRTGARTRWLNLAALILVLVGALAVPATATADPGPWRGDYYTNMTLFGGPAVVRYDSEINFNWGTSAPAGGIPADQFSVNWSAVQYFNAGTYTFSVTVDDGVRVWVDGELIIDQWKDQQATTYSASRYLNAGNHALQVQYYENGGDALCRFWWTAGGGTPPGAWNGEYFNNIFLAGPAALVRSDGAVNFDWGAGSPGPGVAADNFSVRWTTTANFAASQNYTFSATVDDGVRVYVDGALVIDKWYPQSRTTHSATKYLNAGNHTVMVEYFEQGGAALCIVSWTGGGTPPPPGGAVVVDDLSAGFIWGGPAGGMRGRAVGYAGHLYWSWNQTSQLLSWGKWFPHLTVPGNYQVQVYIPSYYHGTKSAKYVIYHGGTSHSKWVNQNNYYDKWVDLGTYYFAGGPSEYVYLGDNTGEPYMTRYVGFDAVRFVPAGGAPPPPPPPPPPSGCAINPILGFGNVWHGYAHVRTKLGCPTEAEVGTWAGAQTFIGGYMFWRQDKTQIYALLSNGTWYAFSDTWNSSMPETDPGIVAPPGYLQPKRGFGKVWRENPAIKSGLSWATIEEYGYNGTFQQYNGGMMMWSPTYGVLVLYSDGRWEKY
jgi:hypothetical protein